MSKTTTVVPGVARRLLTVPVGGQIPTTARLAADLGAGYGTVHAALRALQADRVVVLSTHGHQGTRLVDRDLAALWRASDRGALVGTLPLPQSLEFAGLATAVATVAEKAGMPLELTFRQGAEQRLELLRQVRVDWVATSVAAAARAASWSKATALPEHTYYSRDSVVVITAAGRAPDPRGRVAIDRRSYDHAALTLAEFPDAEHVEAAYWWIPDLVVRGDADAAIWHRTSSSSLQTAAGLVMHPLRRSPPVSGDRSRAALVHRRDDEATRAALAGLFHPAELADLQARVMSHQLPPAY